MPDDCKGCAELRARLDRLEATVCGRMLGQMGERTDSVAAEGPADGVIGDAYANFKIRMRYYRLKESQLHQLRELSRVVGAAPQWLVVDWQWGSREVGVLIEEGFSVRSLGY